jgi:hypothetical protein
VHDLSEMREREVRGLLDESEDRPVCVTYRTDAEGRVVLRPDAPPRWIVGLTAALVGCVSHLHADDLEHADECEAPGTCHEPVHGWHVASSRPSAATSGPSSRDPTVDAALRPDPVTKWQDATSRVPVTPSVPPTRRPTRRPTATPTEPSDGVTLQVNFSVDPENEFRRYVGRLEPTGRLRYTPTREIIDDLLERLRENKRRRSARRRRG